jgi:hypothetical protein
MQSSLAGGPGFNPQPLASSARKQNKTKNPENLVEYPFLNTGLLFLVIFLV